MTERTFTVEPWNTGLRLDRYLAGMAQLSRAEIQRRIDAQRVLVNGMAKTAHDKVKEGDRIVLHDAAAPQAAPADAPAPGIIAEDEDVIVLDKPAGLLVHPPEGRGSPGGGPADGKREPTLIDWLREHVPNIDAVGELHRPGLVHRLDRDVSGIMVVAKTPAMYEKLKEQFKQRLVKKTYTALVLGGPKDDEGTLRFHIGRSREKKRMAARPVSGIGKEAVTTYDVLRRFRTTTLLSVRILTGRTHQIRASLFAAGWPVVGDTLYRQKKLHVNVPPLARPFLHAATLGFEDLAGTWRDYSCDLAPELAAYQAALR